MMYACVSDVLRAKKINPEAVMLIRHTDNLKDGERRFRKAQEAGFIKGYTAMQKKGFAKDTDYLMVFIGEPPTVARFFALYYIANRFPSRAGHVPEEYPNKSEVEAEGEYLDLQEVRLPPDLKGFVIEWGGGAKSWHQQATIEKPIIEITMYLNHED